MLVKSSVLFKSSGLELQIIEIQSNNSHHFPSSGTSGGFGQSLPTSCLIREKWIRKHFFLKNKLTLAEKCSFLLVVLWSKRGDSEEIDLLLVHKRQETELLRSSIQVLPGFHILIGQFSFKMVQMSSLRYIKSFLSLLWVVNIYVDRHGKELLPTGKALQLHICKAFLHVLPRHKLKTSFFWYWYRCRWERFVFVFVVVVVVKICLFCCCCCLGFLFVAVVVVIERYICVSVVETCLMLM